jgi:holo-[acyl-carrier protein] synthase
MIHNIGIDIIEIHRIGEMRQKWGDNFLKKLFTSNEISYCSEKAFPDQHYAVRFACKEAFFKAASEIPDFQFNWKSIEIINTDDGKPSINLLSPINTIFQNYRIHLSLSHSMNYANAVVIIEEL